MQVMTRIQFGAALVGLGVLVYVSRRAVSAASGAGQQLQNAVVNGWDAVSPMNPENIFSEAANGLTRWVTGDQNTTLGGAIYDGVQAVSEGAYSVAPWNHQNVFSEANNAWMRWATGDPNATLGGAIYDLFHPTPATYTPLPFQSGGGGNFQGNGASGSW